MRAFWILSSEPPSEIARSTDFEDQIAMPRRYSLSASMIACATLALASASLVMTTGASFAAPKAHTAQARAAAPAKAKPEAKVQAQAKPEAKGQAKAGEISADPLDRSAFAKATPEEAGACLTARKKLWVEGEGWIVRRVTTCQ
jgi:hypothetical protein